MFFEEGEIHNATPSRILFEEHGEDDPVSSCQVAIESLDIALR